jgi:hypothetical protein
MAAAGRTPVKTGSGLRREPDLPEHVAIASEATALPPTREFDVVDDTDDSVALKGRTLSKQMRGIARQAALDPGDGPGGGAIGIAVSATVANDRTNLHFLRIAEDLNFSNTELDGWLHRMTSHYIQAWGDPMTGQTAALKKLWEAAYREAQVQAFAYAYLVIAVCFAVSAMMVPLMRGVTPK